MTVDNKSRAQHLMGTSDIDNLASAEERETARTMVSRLHVDLGHSDPRGMIDSLPGKHARPHIIATAKKFRCSTCEESTSSGCCWSSSRAWDLSSSGSISSSGRHPVLHLHELGKSWWILKIVPQL